MNPSVSKPSVALAVAVGVCVFIVAAALAGVIWYVKEANAERRADLVAACERGNDARRNINAINGKLNLDLPVLPIIKDCRSVVH